jgi:hypothetical protein
LQHFRAIQALPVILGEARRDEAIYLDACRMKRNTVEYDVATEELLEFAKSLRKNVLTWLKKHHSDLL